MYYSMYISLHNHLFVRVILLYSQVSTVGEGGGGYKARFSEERNGKGEGLATLHNTARDKKKKKKKDPLSCTVYLSKEKFTDPNQTL